MLIGDFPNVRIINAPNRPKSIGETRNAAIALTRPDTIIIHFDDDDLYGPHHIDNFAKHFEPETDWVWLSKQYYCEAWKIKGIVQGSCNVVAYRKSAWEKAGKFPNRDCGEDNDFISRLSATRGKKITIEPSQISFCYNWQNGAFHLSGAGNDKPGRPSGHDRILAWTMDQVRKRNIPVGDIQLKPEARHPFSEMVREFTGTQEIIPRDSTCLLQLGRTGDLLNCLPIAKKIAEREGTPPYLMVSREFAPLLDGIGYVRPYPTSFTVHQLHQAMISANQLFARVIKTQIYGHPPHKQHTLTPSWPQESWRQAKCLEHFHDPEWRLVFDKRDSKREQLLCKKLFRTNKPKIVTNFTSAVSCPFPSGPQLLSAVQSEFKGKYEVVDIGKLRAERIYDLIGVYEKADVIVSIDTATMHLAAAVDVPLVALVNPAHWLGPYLRYNCSSRITYPEASVKRVCEAIRNTPEWMKEQKDQKRILKVLATPPKQGPKLDLKNVTLWACCWSDDKEHQIKTLRALRYCNTIIDFKKTVLFSFLPLPELGFAVDAIQIPQLTPESANTFFATTAPRLLDAEWCLSIHADGFPLSVKHWDNSFFDWHYVAAPWPDGVTGNGGVALEHRKCLEAKTRLPFITKPGSTWGTTFGPLNIIPADVFACRTHRKLMEEMGVKFAPMEVALKFSTEELHKERESFAWHGEKADPVKFARGWKLVAESEVM